MDTVTAGEASEQLIQAAAEARKQYMAERHNGIGLPWPDMVWKVPKSGPFGASVSNTEAASHIRLTAPSFSYIRENDNGQMYSAEWLEFTAEVSQRLGYVLDDTYPDNNIDLGGNKVVSKRMAAFLAMLYDFGFHGDRNVRKPKDESRLLGNELENQGTQFHHYLGVALITSKVQGNGLNDDILVALAHDMFDSQPKKKLATDELLAVGEDELLHERSPQYVEIYQNKIDQIWVRDREIQDQLSVAEKIKRSGWEMDFIEKVAELCRPSKYQEILTASDMAARIISIDETITKLTENTNIDRDPELQKLIKESLVKLGNTNESDINGNITKLSQNLRNKLLVHVGSMCGIESIRAMAANLTHNMLFPRRTDKDEVHESVKRDADEAIDFYVHLLEFREEQEALRALKDISYRIKYPDEYLKLMAAAESLKKDGDPIMAAIETLADNLVEFADFMRNQGFNVITQEEFEAKIMERRKVSLDFNSFIIGSEEVLSQFLSVEGISYKGVIVLQKPRIKGLGSFLGKVLPFKDLPEERDPYHQAILAAYPRIRRYSQGWWKHLITMMGDPLATRMVFHLAPDAGAIPDERRQLNHMKSLFDSFLINRTGKHKNSLVYRADAKAIGEKIIEAIAKPRKKGFSSVVGKVIENIRNMNSLTMRAPGVSLEDKRYDEIIADMKLKDHYRAYHLALAIKVGRRLKRLLVGTDMHFMEVRDYLVSVYGRRSHLNYKLKDDNDDDDGSAVMVSNKMVTAL